MHGDGKGMSRGTAAMPKPEDCGSPAGGIRVARELAEINEEHEASRDAAMTDAISEADWVGRVGRVHRTIGEPTADDLNLHRDRLAKQTATSMNNKHNDAIITINATRRLTRRDATDINDIETILEED